MIGKTEHVILVKGGATKWYEQVIFIVKSSTPAEQMPVDFVVEAEKIINEYNLKRVSKKTPPLIISPPSPSVEKKSKSYFMLGFLMVLACIVVAAIFTFGMMN